MPKGYPNKPKLPPPTRDKTWTVAYSTYDYEEPKFKEVSAPTMVDAAMVVGKEFEEIGEWTAGKMEFRVFEGHLPDPITLEIERQVTLVERDA